MSTILGLIMIIGQILGIFICFGGLQDSPKWLKICIGIAEILMLIAVFGLAMNN